MAEPPFEPEPEAPHNEVWWERELNRNEKLMDKYMAAFNEDPDKFKHPRDLYNKVHFDIDPPDRPEEQEAKDGDGSRCRKISNVHDSSTALRRRRS